jgi:hypothetical protein
VKFVASVWNTTLLLLIKAFYWLLGAAAANGVRAVF